MKRIPLRLCVAAIFAAAAIVAHAQNCPVDPVTGNAPAQMISPANGSTLPANVVTFQWCNANADYFLTVESIPGAHEIFNAFVGGVGPGAGSVSVTLGPGCAAAPPTGCIPSNGKTIFVTLWTQKQGRTLPPSPFQYTYKAASTTTPAPTVTSVFNQTAVFSSTSQNVSLMATVAAASTVNQGTVTFQVMDGAANVGNAVTSATLTDGRAGANYILPGGTAARAYTIQATYSGGANFNSSSGTGTLIVKPQAATPTTTTVVNQTTTFSSAGENVTLTATVAAASAVNQGTVTFEVTDGLNSVGSEVMPGTLTNGSASVTYSLPEGTVPKTYGIHATYSGGPGLMPSSGVGTLTISVDPTRTMTFNLPPDGGSATSSGAGAMAVGYGEISSTATNPVAIANFRYSTGGNLDAALVTEAGVPATTVVTSARMFVDYSADTNFGFALVNPGANPITIKADLKDPKGTTIASATVPLGARSHFAQFVSQLTPALPNPFLGTLTLTSLDGFAAVNLSTVTNGRKEMLFSALPVADLVNPPAGTSLVLSQVVDGAGNPTQILLMNPSSATQSIGKMQLFDDRGAPLALDFGNPGGPQSSLDFVIAPDGMIKYATTGRGTLQAGYAVVTVTSGPLPVGNGIFQFKQESELVSQAGVPSSSRSISTRLYVEVAAAPLYRNTGIAMVNRNPMPSVMTLTLAGFDGSTQAATLTLGPNEHVAKFITELFPGKVPAEFRGMLNIGCTQPGNFTTLRLTINERSENLYSTLPVAEPGNPPKGMQILPQIVNGGGYKTQIMVIGTSNEPGAVYIDFYDESGKSVPLKAFQ